jgi:cell shape-determining protein MreC
MRNFQIKNQHVRRSKPRALWIVLATFSVLAILIAAGSFTKSVITVVMGNGFKYKAESSFLFGGAFALLQSKQELLVENRRLKEEMEKRTVDMQFVDIIFDENEELKRLLGARDGSKHAVTARILARPPLSPVETIILDQGSRAGVSVGDVLMYSKFVFGEISSVSEETSQAVLYSSTRMKHTGLIGSRNIQVELRGVGAGNVEFELSRDLEFSVGDSVRSPDNQGAVFGTIVDKRGRATDPVFTYTVRPDQNILELSFVDVVSTRNSTTTHATRR